jgi:transposase-like protein
MPTLRSWRRRLREHRIREREATRDARARVEEAERAVNLAGHKRQYGGM